MRRFCLVLLFLFAFMPGEAAAACDPDGVQGSGSIYRICMPPPAKVGSRPSLLGVPGQDSE